MNISDKRNPDRRSDKSKNPMWLHVRYISEIANKYTNKHISKQTNEQGRSRLARRA
jgi:hypothetical protein